MMVMYRISYDRPIYYKGTCNVDTFLIGLYSYSYMNMFHKALFARLTYVNVLHWIIRLYYYGFLVNEGIGLILVIQIWHPSSLSVLYSKDVYPTYTVV